MGDTLTNVAGLRAEFALHQDFKDERINPCVGAASRRLKSWVGAEAYADALAEAPQDLLRAEDLKAAEAMLAMHFLLPRINTNVSNKGGVIKTTKETGGQNNPVVTTYLSPSEIKHLAQTYFEQAEEIARPYMLSDGTPEAEFQVTEE